MDDIKRCQKWRTRLEGRGIYRLVNLLARRYSETTDARDKVFAVFGIASDAEDSTMYVDYIQTPLQVFERFARHLLERDQAISILYHTKSTDEDVTSWVPDWASPSVVESPGTRDAERGEDPVHRASSTTLPHMKFVAGQPHLYASGVVFDRIENVGRLELMSTGSSPLSKFQDLVHWGDEARRLIIPSVARMNPYGNSGDSDNAYWRVSVGDRWRSTRRAPPETKQRFEAYVQARHMISEYAVRNRTSHDGAIDGNWQKEFERLLQKAEPYMPLVIGFPETKFITTAKGYFGLIPPNAIKGDVIAVLLGGTVPFLLREDGDCYHIIGDWYIQGIMDGELFQADPKSETTGH